MKNQKPVIQIFIDAKGGLSLTSNNRNPEEVLDILSVLQKRIEFDMIKKSIVKHFEDQGRIALYSPEGEKVLPF